MPAPQRRGVVWVWMMMFVYRMEVYLNPHNWFITGIVGVKQQAALLALVVYID